MKINDLLPVSIEFLKPYNFYSDTGLEFLKEKKIVIVGLARNIENTIVDSIQQLVNFGKTAKDYKIVIFENDSNDNTKQKIQQLQEANNNIIGLYETHNRPQFGPVQDLQRTTFLAEYRNKLVEYVKQHFSDYDFVIVSDMDFLDFSIDGCYNSFGWLCRHGDTIDAVAGNSYQYKYVMTNDKKSLWNYDSWAFRYTWWNQLPILDSMVYSGMLWFGFFIMPPGSTILSVNSAFGGMVIYKTQHFIANQYDGYDCEHVCFHYSLKQNNPAFQLVVNPSQRMLLP